MMNSWPKGWRSFVEAQDERTQKRLTREFNARMTACQEDPTPDPDAARVRLALAAEDIQRAVDNVTLAIIDDPRLDEALDLYRERLRGIRAALEAEAR